MLILILDIRTNFDTSKRMSFNCGDTSRVGRDDVFYIADVNDKVAYLAHHTSVLFNDYVPIKVCVVSPAKLL